MKERPILYSAPMVLAERAGLKTKTRRMHRLDAINEEPGRWRLVAFDSFVHGLALFQRDDGLTVSVRCPYGVVEDRLWTKETWKTHELYDNRKPRDVPEGAPIHYMASGGGLGRVRQSIFMRRWMSRAVHEIVELRLERLQDISESDAMAEGISAVPFYPDSGFPLSTGYMVGKNDGKTSLQTTARGAYSALWRDINGAESWDENPWVWVIGFKRIGTKGT